MRKPDLEIFIPLILIKQVESFRDSYSLTRVLAWKFDLISVEDIVTKLKELQFIAETGSAIKHYTITKEGSDYVESNMKQGKLLMLDRYTNEKSFIELLFPQD